VRANPLGQVLKGPTPGGRPPRPKQREQLDPSVRAWFERMAAEPDGKPSRLRTALFKAIGRKEVKA